MQKVLSLLLILGMSFILQSCNNYVKSIEQFLGLTLPKHQAAGTADSAGTGGNSDTMNVDTDNNSTSDDAYKYLSNFEEERAAIVTELDAAIRIKNSKNYSNNNNTT